MHPVLTVLEWGGTRRAIGSYGACLALALLVGAWLTLRNAIRAGLDEGAVIAVLAGTIGLGLFGAYAASLLVLWVQLGSLQAALLQPGVMFYGGAVSGVCGFALLARASGLPLGSTLDLALPGLPLAHAIGRVGCLLGGCCFGAPSRLPWAMVYTHPLAPAAQAPIARHPWPLYEAACLLALAALFAAPKVFARERERAAQPCAGAAPALRLAEHSAGLPVHAGAGGAPAPRPGKPTAGLSARPGARAALYVLLYAAVRCGLEPLRGDAVRGVMLHGSVSIAQLIGLASGGAALAFLCAHARRPLFARSPQV
jgi:phosphatidylglycerol:prolipoprotein diacylglycerol transferase